MTESSHRCSRAAPGWRDTNPSSEAHGASQKSKRQNDEIVITSKIFAPPC